VEEVIVKPGKESSMVCESNYQQTTTIDKKGGYDVILTFKEPNKIILGSSRSSFLLLLNVDALRAVQTSGQNDTKHVLVTRGPIFISDKYDSRGKYVEQIKTVFVGLYGCFIGVFVPCYANVAGDPN